MSDSVWLRDLDGTGSLHVCSEGDPGAIEFVPSVCQAVDADLLVALKGLHKTCEIALADKGGFQFAYFETRAGHFVVATDAMQQAEAAITRAESAQAQQVAAATDLLHALSELLEECSEGLATCPLTRNQARAAIAKATGEQP